MHISYCNISPCRYNMSLRKSDVLCQARLSLWATSLSAWHIVFGDFIEFIGIESWLRVMNWFPLLWHQIHEQFFPSEFWKIQNAEDWWFMSQIVASHADGFSITMVLFLLTVNCLGSKTLFIQAGSTALWDFIAQMKETPTSSRPLNAVVVRHPLARLASAYRLIYWDAFLFLISGSSILSNIVILLRYRWHSLGCYWSTWEAFDIMKNLIWNDTCSFTLITVDNRC